MPQPIDPSQRAHLEAVCQKLVEAGWISEFFTHDRLELYGLKWTPKGIERARWLKHIATELNLGPKGLTALLVLCELHAD